MCIFVDFIIFALIALMVIYIFLSTIRARNSAAVVDGSVDLVVLWGLVRREILRSRYPRKVLFLSLAPPFFSTVISDPRSGARVRLRFNSEKIVCSVDGAELFEVLSSSPDAPARVGRYVNAFLDGTDD